MNIGSFGLMRACDSGDKRTSTAIMEVLMTMKKVRCLIAVLALSAIADRADAEFLVRIGDVDGFGYGSAPGFVAANGGPANRDGLGPLGDGDFLPDINRDGFVATGRRDEFDFRTAAEIADTSVEAGVGVTSTSGTIGSKFTDISLARSYGERRGVDRILVGGNPNDGLIFGRGGPFPTPPSSTLPNQPGFVFNFEVDRSLLDPTTPIFFNLIFGDYDVVPAFVRIIDVNGVRRRIDLLLQDNTTSNGLIQAATATMDFGMVFADDGSIWRGSLIVDFIAPNEPYTAFDYVELSTTPLVPVPEPSAIVLTGIGLLAIGCVAIRRSGSSRQE